MSEEDSYVPLALNGDEDTTYVSFDEEDTFRPRIFSSPVNNACVNYSSHIRDKSSLAYRWEGSAVGQRCFAGRAVLRRIFDSSAEESDCFDASEIALYAGLPDRWNPGALWQLKYIDDGLKGEKLCTSNAVSHITCKKETKYLHAKRTEDDLKLTLQNVKKIGMRINEEKTNMICITVAKNSLVYSFINTENGTTITGSDNMKMIGFMFVRRPNADTHVRYMRKKFYAKLWVLRFMSRANLSKTELCKNLHLLGTLGQF